MRLLGWRELAKSAKKYSQAKDVVDDWKNMVEAARWSNPDEMKSSAVFTPRALGSDRVKFKIKGNQFRLICMIQYSTDESEGTIIPLFFGTHDDYDKIDPRTVKHLNRRISL